MLKIICIERIFFNTKNTFFLQLLSSVNQKSNDKNGQRLVKMSIKYLVIQRKGRISTYTHVTHAYITQTRTHTNTNTP